MATLSLRPLVLKLVSKSAPISGGLPLLDLTPLNANNSVGETYTFIQAYRTNYYHPMGFGYGPDGAHKGNPELEPTVSMGTSSCDKNATCPAPMYFIGGQYQGQYSNIPEVKNITTNVEDFGLDVYEPTFKHPVAQWTRVGPFEIKLSFDDTTYTNDIYYFCHVRPIHCLRCFSLLTKKVLTV